MNYNLLQEKWIPVLWKNGNTRRESVIKALNHAREIRCINLASPFDFFAVHRFIFTLLYWKAGLAGGVKQIRELLLGGQNIPEAVLAGIKEETHCFDLFNEESPFLQDPNVKEKNKKSAGSLFAECATGTNIAHFHHGDDEKMRLCLNCAILGMLRAVPWSQAGGRGLSPSVHNAPPIMVIATGDNLATTLGLNLVPLDVGAGEPKWSGHFKPTDSTKPIPYLEALTWNPRRISLPPPQPGACWYCGQGDVLTVGKIVYEENENTKLIKKGNKSIPFSWHDPSAFYPDNEYTTVRSYSEIDALDNKDLALLLEKDTDKKKREHPKSLVVEDNVEHQGWHLIIPCTNPKYIKTFDHRQLELNDLSPETIHALMPSDQQPRQGLDGWIQPKQSYPQGIKRFVFSAARLLTQADWGALSNAAFRAMHEAPAAFDVFSGLYWGLRDRKINRLPSRNAAWLVLKLMAAVPTHARLIHARANFSPLQSLPKRQIKERGRTSIYPVSFPRGPRLEAALRDALDRNMRQRDPKPVDWIGFCNGLDQLLD
ncbi:MAG: type I-E CRISPR-associated protein Cse1/CasA [Desulfobaccales bacterium]